LRLIRLIALATGLALLVSVLLCTGCSGRRKEVIDEKSGKDLLKPLELDGGKVPDSPKAPAATAGKEAAPSGKDSDAKPAAPDAENTPEPAKPDQG
jgi:hypothetical protein